MIFSFIRGYMAFSTYRKLVNVLKKKCPVAYPVSVRRVHLAEYEGDCTKVKGKFYIRIDKGLPEVGAIDTLIHEWAHARAWNHLYDSLTWEEFEAVAHDATWGVAYSEVYRIYEQVFLPEINATNMCKKVRPK